MTQALDSLRERCRLAGHEYLLDHWNRLDAAQRDNLAGQIERLDLEQIALARSAVSNQVDWQLAAMRAQPPEAVRLGEAYQGIEAAQAKRVGGDAIAAGRVAMILVAGGQGTRLGFDLPKGMFPIGPVSGRTLFEMHVDSLRGAMKRYGVSIPMLLMTGPSTDAPTREYFARHDRLGLAEEELFIFEQGTMPALDQATGRILLEAPDRIALSPDGHGGIVAALDRSGLLEMARARGIDLFFYAQVDNPLVTACDPLLIGYHLLAGSQMTTQVVKKRFAKERVGNVVQVDGKTQIIEYSDLPDAAAEQCNADGSLKLWAGNIAVHVFDVDFLRQHATGQHGLPFHQARKAVPHVDAEGVLHKPDAPNAIKLERFVFDLLPLADRTLVVEGDASQVFAPVKNAEGAPTDTPSAAKQALCALHKRWLRDAGCVVADDAKVEIHPLCAWDAEEVRSKFSQSIPIDADTYLID